MNSALLRCTLSVLAVLTWASWSFAENGNLISERMLRDERYTTNGCAANSCFLVVRSLCPELSLRFLEVETALPVTRPCSGKEIVDFLRRFPLRVAARRRPAMDAIPSQGCWVIAYSNEGNTQGVGHWFAVFRSKNDDVYVYGQENTYEVKKYGYEEVKGRLAEGFESRRQRGVPYEELAMLIIEVSPPGHSGLLIRALGLFALLGGAWVWSRRYSKSKRLRLQRPTIVLFLIASSLSGCSRPPASPLLSVTNPTRNLGVLVWNSNTNKQELTETFPVRNLGDVPLVIKELKASCTCTQARMSRTLIPPGEEAMATLTVALEQGFSRTVNAMIYSNDPRSPQYLSLSYTMRPLWILTPDSMLFDIQERADPVPKHDVNIDIDIDKSETFAFQSVRCPEGDFRISLVAKRRISRPMMEGSPQTSDFLRYTFEVLPIVSTDVPSITNHRIEYVFSGDLLIQQKVTSIVRSALRSIPEYLVTRRVGSCAEGRFSIVVDKKAVPCIQLDTISCEPLQMTHEIVSESESDTEREIAFKYSFSNIPEGFFQGVAKLQFKVQDEATRVLSLPVTVM